MRSDRGKLLGIGEGRESVAREGVGAGRGWRGSNVGGLGGQSDLEFAELDERGDTRQWRPVYSTPPRLLTLQSAIARSCWWIMSLRILSRSFWAGLNPRCPIISISYRSERRLGRLPAGTKSTMVPGQYSPFSR